MNNGRVLVVIFIVWIVERLAQSVFFYHFSLTVALLTSLVFFAIRFKMSPWSLFVGGVFFDLSSGLPFGVITLAVAAVYLIIILGQKLINFFDSMLLFMFAVAVMSSVSWAMIIRLSGVPLSVFPISAAIIVIETLLISLGLLLTFPS